MHTLIDAPPVAADPGLFVLAVGLEREALPDLAAKGWRCQRVADAAQALQALAGLPVDALLVVDQVLGDRPATTLAALRAATPGPLIVLAEREDEFDEVTALDLGADDYIGRPFSARRLRARLQSALRRDHASLRATPTAQALPKTVTCGAWTLDLPTGRLTGPEVVLDLTISQAKALAPLLAKPGECVPKVQFALMLSYDRELAAGRAIDMHLSNLRRRLAQAGIEAFAIETVRAFGFRLVLRAPSVWPEGLLAFARAAATAAPRRSSTEAPRG